MKKSLLAMAALTAFAGAASAQSSVTLFGIVDMSIAQTSNGSGGNLKSLSNDGINSSRLGVRGVEDMGGGLKAGFWLEGAISGDNGNAAGFNFQRRSTVSLLGAFGEVRLGRDFDPSFWNLTVFDPFGTNGVGGALNNYSTLGSGATTAVRVNNAVSYFLPSLGGIYGQLTAAAGENVQGNKYMGGRLGYAAGPVNVAVAYGKTYRTGAMTDDYTNVNVGGSFDFGFMTLEGYFGKYDYAAQSQKQALLGVLVPIGAGTIKASIIKTTGSSDLYASQQYAVGYQYDLSKRTAVYAQYASLNNGGTNAVGSKFAIGANVNPGLLGGETSSGGQIGLRHSF